MFEVLAFAVPQPLASMDGFDKVWAQIYDAVKEFLIVDAIPAGLIIFGTLLVVHIIMGASELLSGKQCRFLNIMFWVNLIFIGVLVGSFEKVVGEIVGKGFVEHIGLGLWDAFGTGFGRWWKGFVASAEHNEAFVNFLSPAGDADPKGFRIPIWSAAKGAIDGMTNFVTLIVGIARNFLGFFSMLLAGIFGLVLLLFAFIMVLIAFGTAGLTIAVGPICLAFGAHEVTKDIAMNYFKNFLINVVFYLPVFLLAFEIGMAIMLGYTVSGIAGSSMDTAAKTAAIHTAFGGAGTIIGGAISGPDPGATISAGIEIQAFGSTLVGFILGPIAGAGFIIAAPGTVKGLFR